MSFKTKGKQSARIIATLLIVCLAGSQTVYPIPETTLPSDLNLKLPDFSIPQEIGRAEKIAQINTAADKMPTVIHIRDAHGSYEAQLNIQKIIEYLTKEYGVQTVFVEGAVGELNPKTFHFWVGS